MSTVTRVDDGITLAIRVSPNASRNRAGGMFNDPSRPAIKVAVMAPPESGQANEAVRQVLAKHFGIARSDVRVIGGALDRRKTVHIAGNPASLMPLAEELIRG